MELKFISKNTDVLNDEDKKISENINFPYQIIGDNKKNAILLFHGLNEKLWDAYIPMAEFLCKETGKSIILFPIAFHMERCPRSWSDYRALRKVSQKRKTEFPNVENSSIINVSLSERLSENPMRFITSGIQTYKDVLDLISEIKNGDHPFYERGTSFDIFAFSIGSFLSIMLLLLDEKKYFESSKFFSFCGGAKLKDCNANSKFIMDSEANDKVLKLANEFDFQNEALNYMVKGEDSEHSEYFKKILSGENIFSLSLKQDYVIPSDKVKENIPQTEILDFPYKYKHETPFPVTAPEEETEKAFNLVMGKAADFLK